MKYRKRKWKWTKRSFWPFYDPEEDYEIDDLEAWMVGTGPDKGENK